MAAEDAHACRPASGAACLLQALSPAAVCCACRGFVAAPSHVDFGGIKTMASMADCVAAAVEGLGIASRREERAAA